MGLRHVRLSLKSRPDSSQSILVPPDLIAGEDTHEREKENSATVIRDVWDEAYVQLKTDPATAEIITDYEHVLIAALRPISPEHAHGLDRNPSHWVAHLEEPSRHALIEALVTRGCDAFERSSYGRKMLSFVALSIDKMKSTIENMVEICPPSSTAWLAACLIIAPVIINNARKIESQQPGVNYVVSRMPWYTELTKVPTLNSWKTPELRAAINGKVVELYKLLIRYLLASARYYDHSSYRFAPNRAKWDSWENMVNDIKAAEAELEECIHLHSGKPLKRALNEGARQGENIKSIVSVFSIAQRRANLMDKIMPDAGLSNAHTYQDYVNQIANPHSNTGHGVLSHPTFTSWAGASNGLLVLAGQPGSGKSVLAKYLLTELPRVRPVSLCSFFFKDGGEQNNLNTAMYEVLDHILRQCSVLDAVEEKAEQATRHSVRPDSDLFWELVEIASQGTPHGRVTIVLDAMDECKNAHLATALKLLNDYQSKFPNSNVKFLLTSRPVPDILQLLTNATILHLDEDAECRESIMGDIARVAEDRVEQFASERCIRDATTKAKLRKHLEVQPNPSYLFTDLLFTFLGSLPVRPGTNYWSRTFDHLPTTVFGIYRALLDQIHDSNRDDVRIMLEIVLAATKPLSVREMAIALALHIDDCTNCDQEDQLGLPTEDFRAWIRETCGPFFDIYHDHVYFTHQTVRDYLLSDDDETQKPTWLAELCVESCHKTMAQCCFAYQALPFVAAKTFMTLQEYIQAPFYSKRKYHTWCRDNFEFAEHAFAKWAIHVQNSYKHSVEKPADEPEPVVHDVEANDDNVQQTPEGTKEAQEENQEQTIGKTQEKVQTDSQEEDTEKKTQHESQEQIRATSQGESPDESQKELQEEVYHETKLEVEQVTQKETENEIQQEVQQETEQVIELETKVEIDEKTDQETQQQVQETIDERSQEDSEAQPTEDIQEDTEATQQDEPEDGTRTNGTEEDQSTGQPNEASQGAHIPIDRIKEMYPDFHPVLALPIFCCSGLSSSNDVEIFVSMFPQEDSLRDDMITSLSQSLMARYCQFSDGVDLQYGASLAEEVLERTTRGHPGLTQRLANFDQGLNMRFWDVVDHDVPITGNEMREADKAVTVTPAGHPRRTLVLHHRAAVLERQYQRTKDPLAISQAIDDIVGVVELINATRTEKSRYLDYLANLLGQRYLDGGDSADLNLAIKAAEEAVSASQLSKPTDEKLLAINRSTLASWLGARYRITQRPDDIDRALEAIRLALAATPEDDPSQPIYLCSHARRLYERYEQTGVDEDIQEAMTLSRKALELTPEDHPLYSFHRLFAQVLSKEESQ